MNLRLGNEGCIPTMNKNIDVLLDGGLKYKHISHFYGDPGTGKTNFAKQVALSAIKNNDEVIWIDSIGGFSLDRIIQMADGDEEIAKKINLFSPRTIGEQKKILETLDDHINLNQNIKLIVFDVFTFFYRYNLNKYEWFGRHREIYDIQLPKLVRLVMNYPIHIIIINQVRGDIKKGVVPVSVNDINKVCKYVIRFESSRLGDNKKCVILEKIPNTPKKSLYAYVGKKVICEINDRGMINGEI